MREPSIASLRRFGKSSSRLGVGLAKADERRKRKMVQLGKSRIAYQREASRRLAKVEPDHSKAYISPFNAFKSPNLSMTTTGLQKYFATNATWAQTVQQAEPAFFPTSAQGQQPKILWVGCADSRVPESVLLAVRPGEVFVHRNIANQFHLNDDSALSVLTYAVEALGVKHIVVAGHTQCGGARGAFDLASKPATSDGGDTPLGRWLTPLVELAQEKGFVNQPEDQGVLELIKASVERQVNNIAGTDVIKRAWENKNPISIHGWLYRLEDGRLEDLGIDVYPPNAN